MPPKCTPVSDAAGAPKVCALPPIPLKTGAVSAAAADDGRSITVTLAAATSGGSSARLGCACTISSGGRAYTKRAPSGCKPQASAAPGGRAAGPSAPATTAITFAVGDTDDGEAGGGAAGCHLCSPPTPNRPSCCLTR